MTGFKTFRRHLNAVLDWHRAMRTVVNMMPPPDIKMIPRLRKPFKIGVLKKSIRAIALSNIHSGFRS
jgi:hypothetical protein